MSREFELLKGILSKEHQMLNQAYGVSRLAVFGSFARGEETPTSDIDILVEFERPIGLFRFVQLEAQLADLLNRRVDLVTEKALKPALKPEILQDAVYV
ncbi:MAG: nucleotidyltransferase family protein [Anaerolineales bacterium]|jgi:predicted nucleotidyltransferase|nr:nucleotidyltransferase family protein [Anaerolineales bacterium]MCW5888777.1 nucleotidyltransferase family protein [Anaerolineales bacterium]